MRGYRCTSSRLRFYLSMGAFCDLMECLVRLFTRVVRSSNHRYVCRTCSICFVFFRFCSYELRCQCSECKRRCSNFHNTSIGLAGFYAQVGWGPPVVHRYVEHLQDKRTLQAVLGTVKWTTFQKGLDQRFLPCCCYKPSSEMQPSRKSSKRCPIWRTQCVACILSRAPFV